MNKQKLGEIFSKLILVEDSLDICDFYKEFFESEHLQLDILHEIPKEKVILVNRYDVLICDWLVGEKTSKKWLYNLNSERQLPRVTIVVTGMLDIEHELTNLPVKLVYKPFDFFKLKEIMIDLRKNQSLLI